MLKFLKPQPIQHRSHVSKSLDSQLFKGCLFPSTFNKMQFPKKVQSSLWENGQQLKSQVQKEMEQRQGFFRRKKNTIVGFIDKERDNLFYFKIKKFKGRTLKLQNGWNYNFNNTSSSFNSRFGFNSTPKRSTLSRSNQWQMEDQLAIKRSSKVRMERLQFRQWQLKKYKNNDV